MLTFKIDLENYIQNGDICQEDIDQLKARLNEIINAKIPKLSDEQVAIFLNACNRDLDDSYKCILAYFSARKSAPELFNNRVLSRTDVQQQLKTLDFCVLPNKNDDGYTIGLHRLVNSSPWAYQMDVAMKVLFMCLDAILYDDLPKGLIMIFDMKGVGLMHLARVNLVAVRKFFYYLQEALPIQLKAIHVLNTVSFLDRILKIIRPFMKQEIFELIHFHAPNTNMEDFYKNYIPKDLLPLDYGGTLDVTVRELHNDLQQKLEELQDHFAEEQQLRENSM